MKYNVVYICDTLPDQVVITGVDFEDAHYYAASMTAEIILKGSKLSEESYVVQPG
jgi:hypothetical protein